MNARQIRAEFRRMWNEHCNRVPADKTDKPAMRTAFCDFVDYLARNGHISERVANRVTLS